MAQECVYWVVETNTATDSGKAPPISTYREPPQDPSFDDLT